MTASLFVQGLINGLNQGAIYALIALGYTMVYGIIRMINFAHGDFIMIGAYTLFYTIPLMVDAGMPAWMAVIVAVAVCALVGVLVEILAYRPVRKAGPMSALITALAMSIFLENLAMVLFGAKPHNVQAIFSLPTITVGGVSLPLNVLLTIGIGVAMMLCMQLFVKKTKLGKAMRAVPQDKDASTLVGINVNKIITLTFAIGSGLAAVAALMYCSTYPRVTTDMGSMMGMKAFIAAVLGGIGITHDTDVIQQHGDGHGPHAAGHRGDVTRHGACFLKVHIAVQLAVRTAVDADIDHHGAGLDHIAGHKTSAANGGNQNIRVGADFFQVGRVGMADRNGCIFSQQQQGCGLAHNVGTADDHGVFAVNFGAGRFDHADAARRGACLLYTSPSPRD